LMHSSRRPLPSSTISQRRSRRRTRPRTPHVYASCRPRRGRSWLSHLRHGCHQYALPRRQRAPPSAPADDRHDEQILEKRGAGCCTTRIRAGHHVLERGPLLRVDGPSVRTLHVNLDEAMKEDSDQQADLARISGKTRPEFPEPTLAENNGQVPPERYGL